MSSGLHHVEIWVADLDAGRTAWAWLLTQLGWSSDQSWPEGQTFTVGDTYIVVTRPPTLDGDTHNRRLPGINHLALHGGSRSEVDQLVDGLDGSGWVSLYAERYPHAGGEDHYAAYLQNAAGFKVEVVASGIR